MSKLHKPGKANADPLRGLSDTTVDGRLAIVGFEPDSDAWIKEDTTKIGYEVSFARHLYKPQPLRTLEEINADTLAIEKEAEGLLDGLLQVGAR